MQLRRPRTQVANWGMLVAPVQTIRAGRAQQRMSIGGQLWALGVSDLAENSRTECRPCTVDAGLVLLDRSLKILAYDRGAAAILRDANQRAVQRPVLPKEIDNIRQCKLTALPALRFCLRIGKDEYMCRAYLLEWLNWLASQPIVAVHLMRILTSNDAVHDASVKYQLTAREQEALRGISLGLANKTIADRMAISPNTVKAFLRLIMIKMGVTSRAGIVATMLQNRPPADKRSGLPGFLSSSEVKVMPVAKAAAAGLHWQR